MVSITARSASAVSLPRSSSCGPASNQYFSRSVATTYLGPIGIKRSIATNQAFVSLAPFPLAPGPSKPSVVQLPLKHVSWFWRRPDDHRVLRLVLFF